MHYWAVENLDARRVDLRGTANGIGDVFQNIMLTPGARYRFWVMRAETLWVGYSEATAAGPGTRLDIPPVRIAEPNLYDSDRDGLPEVCEMVAGTNPAVRDTDGDGVLDGAEVRQGTNPLDGVPASTGVIAQVDTPGDALDVCALNDVAVVADGPEGVTAFTVFNRMNPRAIARVATAGPAERVACVGTWAAVATRGGVDLVDLSDPPAARVRNRVDLFTLLARPTAVAAADRVVFAGTVAGDVVAIDLLTGGVLDRFPTGEPVIDLAIEGLQLYVLSERRLSVVPLGRPTLAAASFVAAPPGVSWLRVFVGGGTAYAVHTRGYDTVDVRSNTSPALIAHGVTRENAWRHLVANGSGLGFTAVGTNIPGDVSLYDVSDPTMTDRLRTGFVTPGEAKAVAIFNGLGYTADGSAGLAVVNYLPFDNQGRAPRITLSGTIDFTRQPVAAEEGKLVVIRADVTDDVQVRNVEFWVDGTRRATDGTFPFELHLTTPSRALQPRFTVRAIASDTGGNMTATQDIAVTLTPDATGPEAYRTIPRNGAVLGTLQTIGAFLSEPAHPTSLVPANVQLVEAGPDGTLGNGDDVVINGGAVVQQTETLAILRTFDAPLRAGRYRASLLSAVIDLAGNRLAAPATWSFTVYDSTRDTDRDGLPDAVETALGLDPMRPDTNGNGVADGAEDADSDGLTNAAEILLGRDPSNPDSDGNGIPDGAEDLDADGLADGREIALGTNPFERDTDGDGFLDGDEVREMSSPTNARSTPLRFVAGRPFTALGGAPRPIMGASVKLSGKNIAAPWTMTPVGMAAGRNDAARQATAGATQGPAFTLRNTP